MIRYCAAAFLLASALPALAADDPWAPAREGKILCGEPDLDHKTCQAFSEITIEDGGHMRYVDRWIEPMVATDVVISMASEAELKGGKSCIQYRHEIIQKTSFTRAGEAVPEEEASAIRERLKGALEPMLGREICMRLSLYGGRNYNMLLWVDGQEMPSLSRWAAWVAPDEGFQLVSP